MDTRESTVKGPSQKEGYVWKRAPEDSRCVFPWNKRYLQLKDGVLKYYEDVGACINGKSGKMIDLQGCVDVKEEEPTGNYCHLFSIETSREWSSNGRKFLINALDDEDRKTWIDGIKMALKLKNQESTTEEYRVIRSNTEVSLDSGISLSRMSLETCSEAAAIHGETTISNSVHQSQESKTEDFSLMRTKTTTSADSGTGSLSEVSLQTENDVAKYEEETDFSDAVKQPMENDEHSKYPPEERSSENDEGSMAPQTRSRINEVITSGSLTCPHCLKQFEVRGQISYGKKKKPTEGDLRNVPNHRATENTDCAGETKQ